VQLPGGQSAHVDSPNYDDLLELYLSRTPVELVFDLARAEAEAIATFDFSDDASQ
jgi:acyl-homoserine lactone acylase PvdQ